MTAPSERLCPFVKPEVCIVGGSGSVVKNLVAQFLATAQGKPQAAVEKDGVVVVEAVGRKAVLFHIKVGKARDRSWKSL